MDNEIKVPKNGWTVQWTSFKYSGKYYSDGEYQSFKTNIFEVFEEVVEMRREGKSPDLVDGATGKYYVLIRVPEHPHDHPHLFLPLKSSDED
jgi:hypothetical protein